MISYQFFCILLGSVLIYWLLPVQKQRVILLIISSLLFLGWVDMRSLIVMLGLTTSSYLFAILLQRYGKKRFIHSLSIVSLLLVLILFKYMGFLAGVTNSLIEAFHGPPLARIEGLILPLGLSYLIFKHISYLTDIKWNLITPGTFLDFLLYSSLFTIYVAGPIERYEQFEPQLRSKSPFDGKLIYDGISRIVIGMVKKLVIADWIGYYCNPLWNRYGGDTSWFAIIALIGYSFQIYFDFSGYSDIAIGASKLFGLRIMENFDNPYLSPNLSQFWRRWHISLSDWIRDYLFFPLSSWMRKPFQTKYVVPIIAMAACGLWHGGAWHFVLWGVWHGMGLAILQYWNGMRKWDKQLAKATRAPWFRYAGIAMTFSFVTLGWWWFR